MGIVVLEKIKNYIVGSCHIFQNWNQLLSLSSLQREFHEEQKQSLERVLKASRRSNLLQEDIYNVLLKLEQKADAKTESIVDEAAAAMAMEKMEKMEKGVLQILDLLLQADRLSRLNNDQDMIAVLASMHERLCQLVKIRAVAIIGSATYDSAMTVIIEAVYNSEIPRGSVVDIVSQGYVRENQTIIRKAKIIVSTDKEIVSESRQ
ncbi:MAG: nucleotide exchange factor GrpE [Oligoflexia bacterium]|nr:nucleotide exchange factor GrpE [Oligoflexia bacterium]